MVNVLILISFISFVDAFNELSEDEFVLFCRVSKSKHLVSPNSATVDRALSEF